MLDIATLICWIQFFNDSSLAFLIQKSQIYEDKSRLKTFMIARAR